MKQITDEGNTVVKIGPDGAPNRLSNVADPENDNDAVNKAYVKSYTASKSFNIIGTLTADMNLPSLTDQQIDLVGGNTFHIHDIIQTNPSLEMDTAAGGAFYEGAGQTGYNIADVGVNAESNLVDPEDYIALSTEQMVINPDNPGTNKMVGNKIYYSLATPQGVASTTDIYIIGFALS